MDINTLLPGWQLVVAIAILIVSMVGGITWIVVWYGKKAYPYKVLILEEVPNLKQSKIRSRDKAKLITIGDGGEEVYYLKKNKKYRTSYGNYIGANYLCWTIAPDGYWYNTSFGQVTKNLKELGIMPVNKDVRYASASTRKMVKDNYQSKSFMEKYAPIVYFSMFFLLVILFAGIMWFSFDKQAAIASSTNEGIKTAERVMELVGQVTSNLDNICSGGSGFAPAT